MDNDRQLMSVGETAQQLRRSTEQVRRYLREGRLQGRRIGGQWFIDRNVLEQFMTSHQRQQGFLHGVRPANDLHPLDDVIGIGQGIGTNIGEGKNVYRTANLRRR